MTLGIALMGCGRIAQRYGQIFSENQITDSRFVAACDVKPDRASDFSQKYNVPCFNSLDDMLDKCGNDIDVICILTESGLHADHCVQVAAAGKHVIVEKPMALTLKDADRMISACDQAGVKLLVVKQNRLNKPVQYVRDAFDKGLFGKPTMASVRVRWRRDQDYYDQDTWRGTWAMDGGVFANQAIHHIDLIQWFLGDPISVYAKSRSALANVETEDTGVSIIEFSSGALGVIEATTATRPDNLEGSFSLLGSKGTAVIGGFAVNKLETLAFDDSARIDQSELAKQSENPPNVYGFGHRIFLQDAVNTILYGKASLVDGFEGRKSLELICAIYESIETGQEISMRFRPQLGKLGNKHAPY